jgi:hypothetical protein
MKSTVGSGQPWTSQYFGNMTFVYAASGSSAKWNSIPTCGMENSMTKCSVTTSYGTLPPPILPPVATAPFVTLQTPWEKTQSSHTENTEVTGNTRCMYCGKRTHKFTLCRSGNQLHRDSKGIWCDTDGKNVLSQLQWPLHLSTS